MFVLSALCVLLPLAAALDTCDNTKSTAFLASPLAGNPLHTLEGRNFWIVASGADGAGNHHSVEIDLGSAHENTIPSTYLFRDTEGTIYRTLENSYTQVGDHMTSTLFGSHSIYFFQCSENLIGGYRCADEDTTVTGTKYHIWAGLDKNEADVVGELDSCLAKILELDASATFVRRYHP